jgi:GTP cyclohydrolase IA
VSRSVTWQEVYQRLAGAPPGRLYGIPRGGAIVAGLTGRAVDALDDADWIVDDVADSGRTMEALVRIASKPVWTLFDRERDGFGDSQLVLPWEDVGSSRLDRLERLGGELLETLGYDCASGDLRDTPARWAKWWIEFLSHDAGRTDVTFELKTQGQLVVVGGLTLWSVCEHHLLPFMVMVSVGYVPSDRVLGLSKVARIARRAAHKLQLQERLVEDITGDVRRLAATEDVIVLGRGRHLCLEARGTRAPAVTSTVSAAGAFRRRSSLRREFLSLCGPDANRWMW